MLIPLLLLVALAAAYTLLASRDADRTIRHALDSVDFARALREDEETFSA